MHPDFEKRLTEAAESTATQIARIADILEGAKKELNDSGIALINFFDEMAMKYGMK